MAAQKAYVGNIFAAVGYGHFARILADGDEGYNLVVRALDVELNLRVLVGYAEALHGGGAGVYYVAVVIFLLADALCPELAVPV